MTGKMTKALATKPCVFMDLHKAASSLMNPNRKGTKRLVAPGVLWLSGLKTG